MVKFYRLDKDGRVSYTEKEFKEIIEEVYKEGYEDGKKETMVTISPSTDYYTRTNGAYPKDGVVTTASNNYPLPANKATTICLD